MLVLGIDLAGSEKRDTGICILDEQLNAEVWVVYTNSEIISIAKKYKPDLIAIDAPLSLPKGRRSLDRPSPFHFRECDKELRRLGIKFFPITLGPMRMLTKRGIMLRKIFRKLGFRVIEVYPGATQDILNIPRKQKSLDKLQNGLKKLGIKLPKRKLTGDELDAVTAAYTGWLYLIGRGSEIGDPEEGVIIIPKL